jgi:hypothetical protein
LLNREGITVSRQIIDYWKDPIAGRAKQRKAMRKHYHNVVRKDPERMRVLALRQAKIRKNREIQCK